MSETKHKPGPWVAQPDYLGPFIEIYDGDDRAFAASALTLDNPREDAVGHATAYLIAAAPDLLAACEEMVAYLRNLTGDFVCDRPDECGAPRCRVGRTLRAAIAKAKGEA